MRTGIGRISAVMAICACLAGAQAAGPDVMPGPEQVLRGAFEQQRQLAGFETPLVSNGSFIVAGDRGVVWRTEAPFRFDLVITPSGVIQIVPGDPPIDVMPAQAGAARLFSMFTDIFRSDPLDQASQTFDVQQTSEPGALWSRKLIPISEQLAAQIEAIMVSGADFVDRVEIRRTSGDRDTLTFSNQSLSDDPLSETERELLNTRAGATAAP